MSEYKPLEYFKQSDSDHSSMRVRDMPYGKAKEEITLYPSQLVFGEVMMGKISTPKVILITNTGYNEIIIEEITVVGDFIYYELPIMKLQPGQTVELLISFQPKQPGVVTGGVYVQIQNAAGTQFAEFSGNGVDFIPGDTDIYMPKTGGTFTGPVGMDLGTIAENYPSHPDNATRGHLPFASPEGGISIHGTQLRLWADMSEALDGDYDADLASKSNMYLVAGGGIQLIPSTNGFLPWNENGTIKPGGTLGRIRVASDEIANYIQSGGNYSGTWDKDLILTRYNTAAPWMVFDESESGNCGIGYLFPKTLEAAANGDPYMTWQVKYRLHVIDSAVGVAKIESTGASARLLFHDAGTTDEVTIGSNGNELVFRTNDLYRLKIGPTATYPGVHDYHSLGKIDYRWAAGYIRDLRPGAGTVLWTSGANSPEGVVTGPPGSLYTRTNGAAGSTLYIKEAGTGSSGWVAYAGSSISSGTDWASITGKPSTFPPSAHSHQMSDVMDLETNINLKAPLASPSLTGTPTVPTAAPGTSTTQIASTAFVGAAVAANVEDWSTITGKPTTFAPSTHSHPQSEVTNLVTDLSGKAPTIHTHAQADITNLVTDLNLKAPIANPTFTGQATIPAGTVSAPGLAMFGNPNYGIFGTTTINFAILGVQKFSIGNTASSFGSNHKVTFAASTTNRAGLATPHGVAPSAPVDGDFWSTTAGFYGQVNGVTVGPFGTGGGGGISEAPNDGKPYVRKSLGWDDFTDELALKADVSALAGKIDDTGDTMSGPLVFSHAGTAAASSINFGTANTGIWGDATSVRIGQTGTLKLTVGTAIAFGVSARGANGTISSPSFSFSNDTDAGLYLVGAGDMRLSMAGADVAKWLDDKTTTFYGKVIGTLTATTAAFNIGVGSPSVLADGDIYTTPGGSIVWRGAGVSTIGVSISQVQTITGAKTFSTSPILPTPTAGDNSTKGATTAYVDAADALKVNISAIGTAAAKNISIGTTAPGSPAVNDLWVDTN